MLKLGESGQALKSEHFLSESDDTVVIKYQDDIEPVIDSNRAAQNDFVRFGNETFSRLAEIPNILIVKWMTEEGLNFYKKEDFEYILKKKLNDPDYRYLKTIPGRI